MTPVSLLEISWLIPWIPVSLLGMPWVNVSHTILIAVLGFSSPLWSSHPSCLWWLSAATGLLPPQNPYNPRTPLLPLPNLGLPVAWLLLSLWGLAHREKQSWSSSRILGLISQKYFWVLVKKMSSGPSSCKLDLKWQIHSDILVSLRLWIPISTLNQRRLDISNSFTVS